MSEITTNIADHPKFQYRKSLRPTIRVFDLGEHEYSGAPGLSWRTNYWVKKINKGKQWELYCSQEESLRKREYAGTYKPQESPVSLSFTTRIVVSGNERHHRYH